MGVILTSLFLLQCGGPKGENTDTTAVQIKLVGAPGAQKTSSATDPDCQCLLSVTLDVTGPQMDAVRLSDSGFPGDEVVFELDLPNGADRRFAVRVTNADQKLDLEGFETRTLDGEPQVIIMDLRLTPVLSVKTIGNGRVASTPAGIDCGSGFNRCDAPFSSLSPVTLTAIPDLDFSFIGWSSDPPVENCAGATPSISLTLTTANTNCTALFTP